MSRNKVGQGMFIAILAGVIVIAIQGYVLFDTYRQEHLVFVTDMVQRFDIAMKQLDQKAMKNVGGKYVVGSPSKEKLIVVKDGNRHEIKLLAGEDVAEMTVKAMYDIRDTSRWKLICLDSIFKEDCGDTNVVTSYTLVDSTGKLLDYYSDGGLEPGRVGDEYTVTLGVLEKHQLIARFVFSWGDFLVKVWDKLATIFVLLVMLVACMAGMMGMFRRERWLNGHQALFIQSLNHDLKFPVTRLSLQHQRLKENTPLPYSGRQKELYEQMRKGFAEISDTIVRILRDSLEIDSVGLDRTAFELNPMLEEAVGNVRDCVPEDKKAEITVVPGDENMIVTADRFHLARMVVNLLENALKYSGPEVKITVAYRRVGKRVEIMVKDNGFGIEKAAQKFIFEKNFRAIRSVAGKKIKGFGLGLTYVRTIAVAHGGTVKVNSRVNEGSEFILRLKI